MGLFNSSFSSRPPRRSSAPRFRRLHPPAHARARSARRAARRRRPGPERARAPSHTRSTRGAERGRSSPGDRAGAVESARATFPGRGLGLGRRRGGERADHRRVRRGARLEARYDGLRCVPAGLGVEVEVRVRVPRPGPRRRDVLPVRHLRACPSASLSPGPAPRHARDEDATGGEEIGLLARPEAPSGAALRPHRRRPGRAPSPGSAARARGPRLVPPPAAPRRNARARPRPARRPRRPSRRARDDRARRRFVGVARGRTRRLGDDSNARARDVSSRDPSFERRPLSLFVVVDARDRSPPTSRRVPRARGVTSRGVPLVARFL